MVKPSENPIYRMDIVLSINREIRLQRSPFQSDVGLDLIKDIKSFFKEYCDQWVFQLECPEDTENYHFQCRVNLKEKQRTSTFANLISNSFCGFPMESFYRIGVGPTNKNQKTRFSYVMKNESRVLGPWSDRKVYEGEDIITDLYPYQRYIYEILTDENNWDSRKIHNIFDPKGGHGKSSIVKRLAFDHPEKVGFITTCSSAQQLTSSLVKCGPKSLYIVDLPRVGMSWMEYNDDGIGKRKYSPKWAEIVMVLETLKNGGPLIDTMHGRNEMLVMQCPNIVIFSNWPLEHKKGDYFSIDRISRLTLTDQNYKEVSFNKRHDFGPGVPTSLKGDREVDHVSCGVTHKTSPSPWPAGVLPF